MKKVGKEKMYIADHCIMINYHKCLLMPYVAHTALHGLYCADVPLRNCSLTHVAHIV